MYFARSIHRSEKEDKVIQGIVNLAHTLDLRVIAEGVETKEQLDFLSACGCDEIQGYYFYKPISLEELEEVLQWKGQKYE